MVPLPQSRVDKAHKVLRGWRERLVKFLLHLFGEGINNSLAILLPFISGCREGNEYRYGTLIQLGISPRGLIVLLGKFGPRFKEGLMAPVGLVIVLFLGLFIWYACTINVLYLCGTLTPRGCCCLANLGYFTGTCDIFEDFKSLWCWASFTWCNMILGLLSRSCLRFLGPLLLLIRSWKELGGYVGLKFSCRAIRSGQLFAKALLPPRNFAYFHVFHTL